ncbi:TRPA1 [Bugula neritina]|uniref:TRPA1 n=1 Tax=Bugula neritina TaxID=10212 RepID=A0A7J7JP05_BUGNE|nr:TRPA1 [Bugula neritina]
MVVSNHGDTLHTAKDKQTAKQLLESVPPFKRVEDLLTSDANGQTALHVAVIENNVEVVEYFCSIRHVIDALALCKDSLGRTALHYVSSVEIVKLLPLSDLLATDNHGRTVLHTATINGYFDVIDYFCDTISSAHLIHSKDENGCTPLHYAPNKQIARRIVESLENLSEKRQYVLKRNNRQRTVLHSAAHNGRCEVISYLCELISQKEMLLADDQCKTALHYAKDSQVAKLLLDLEPRFIFVVDKCYCTALHLACYEGRNDVVAYICNISISSDIVWQKDNQGRTPLHLAFDYKTALILLESVPDYRQFEYLMTRDNHGCTALHAAAHLANTIIMKYEGNLLQKNIIGCTAFHYALNGAVAEKMVAFLKSSEARELVFSVDEYFQTVLHLATQESRNNLLRYLCDQYPGLLMKTDSSGKTALHYVLSRRTALPLCSSVEPGRLRDLLLIRDQDGQTALHSAVEDNNLDVVKVVYESLMVEEKLNTIRPPAPFSNKLQTRSNYFVDRLGRTPLHTAAIAGHAPLIKYLCNQLKDDFEMILARDAYMRTALHYAATPNIAWLLFEHLRRHQRQRLILSRDIYKLTAVAAAHHEQRYAVQKYLCKVLDLSTELKPKVTTAVLIEPVVLCMTRISVYKGLTLNINSYMTFCIITISM